MAALEPAIGLSDGALALRLHPDSRCDAVDAIEAVAQRSRGGALDLVYRVSGRIADLRIPLFAPPARTDDLWRHTCLEAFAAAAPDAGYHEFNLAPSSQWAAYRFVSYREGMAPAAIEPPRITMRSTPEHLELHATLALGGLDDLPLDAPWRLGLSAVIEETNGNLSYWALAHPQGRADFHNEDCFALDLPPAP